MKKLLLLILFIVPALAFAQTNTTPQFKRNIPADSLLGYSIPGITGNHWLPDTAWVKKHAGGGSGGSFLPLAGGIMTGSIFINTNGSDSLGYWFGNGAHGIGSDRAGIYLSQRITDHTRFTQHLDDNAHFDVFAWEINTNSGGGPADNHDVATLNLDKFDVKSDSILLRNYLFFTSGITQNHTIKADSTQFDSNVTDGTTVSDIFANANQAIISSGENSSNNSADVNTTSNGGAATGFHLNVNDGGSGNSRRISSDVGTGSLPGIIVSDGIGHDGIVGDELFTVSGDPNQYVQFGNMTGGGGNTIYTADDSLTSNRTVGFARHTLSLSDVDGNNAIVINPNNGHVDILGSGSSAHTNVRSYNSDQSNGADLILSISAGNGIAQLRVADTTSLGAPVFQIIKMQKGVGYSFQNPLDGLGANYDSTIDTAASIAAFGGLFIPDKAYNDSHYAVIGGSGVASVSGTANRTTSTGGTTPVIDISSTFEALLSKLAANNVFAGNNTFSSSLTLNGGANFAGNAANFTNAGNVGGISAGTLTAGRSYLLPDKNGTFAMTSDITVTPSSTNTFTNKSGNISQWTNDSGYITSAPTGANPTATATTTAVNGSATTFMRSDAAPKVDSSIFRTVANSYSLSGMATKLGNYVLGTRTVAGFALSSNVSLAALTATNTTLTFSGSYDGSTARTVGLNVSNANTWGALQTFGTNISIGGVTATGATGTGAIVYATNPTINGQTVYATSNFSTTTGAILDGTANFSTQGATNNSGSGSTRQLLMGAAFNMIHSSFGSAATGPTLGVSNTAASVIIGTSNYKIAASGTNAIVTGLAVLPPTITATAGSGVLTNAATYFSPGAPTGATNNYDIWAVGLNRMDSLQTTQFKFGGSFGTSGQMPIINGSGTLSWVTAYTGLITGTPTIVAGTGAGTSPTVSVTTNGKQLQVTVTTGTLPTGTNATIATVTLPNALSYTPLPVFSSASAATALLNGASMIYMTSTGTANVTITSGTTALTAATTYVWNIVL